MLLIKAAQWCCVTLESRRCRVGPRLIDSGRVGSSCLTRPMNCKDKQWQIKLKRARKFPANRRLSILKSYLPLSTRDTQRQGHFSRSTRSGVLILTTVISVSQVRQVGLLIISVQKRLNMARVQFYRSKSSVDLLHTANNNEFFQVRLVLNINLGKFTNPFKTYKKGFCLFINVHPTQDPRAARSKALPKRVLIWAR